MVELLSIKVNFQIKSASNGDFIGPMRVWIQEDSIPGLAMSRSFGDKIASTVGVIAVPGKWVFLTKKFMNGISQRMTNLLF